MSLSIRPTTPVVRKPVTAAQKPVTAVEKPVTPAQKPVVKPATKPESNSGLIKNVVKWGSAALAAGGGAYAGYLGGGILGYMFAMAGMGTALAVLPAVGLIAGAAAAGGGVYALANWLTKKF